MDVRVEFCPRLVNGFGMGSDARLPESTTMPQPSRRRRRGPGESQSLFPLAADFAAGFESTSVGGGRRSAGVDRAIGSGGPRSERRAKSRVPSRPASCGAAGLRMGSPSAARVPVSARGMSVFNSRHPPDPRRGLDSDEDGIPGTVGDCPLRESSGIIRLEGYGRPGRSPPATGCPAG